MRAGRLGAARPTIQINHAVILFWVGPYRMGIEAGALKEIQNDLHLMPETTGCEAILSAHTLLGVSSGRERRLLVLRPGRVGVCVDRVERMIEVAEVRPLPLAFQGTERQWYSGLIVVDGLICPLMNAATLLREGNSSRSGIHVSKLAVQKPSREAVHK